jgi:hypothetical protein
MPDDIITQPQGQTPPPDNITVLSEEKSEAALKDGE